MFDLFNRFSYCSFYVNHTVISSIFFNVDRKIYNCNEHWLLLSKFSDWRSCLWLILHLHQFTRERFVITASLTDDCCSFLSEWFSYKSFKFLSITIRFCFQHSVTFVSTILQTLLLNKWPPQIEYTLEIKNRAWIDNQCRVNRG